MTRSRTGSRPTCTKPVALKPAVVPYQLKELNMKERLTMKRSKENFEKEWAWLFDGLPVKHRAKLEENGGMAWLVVSFLDGHKKAVSTEKYLLRDLLQHEDEYRKAVEAQCSHAYGLVRSPESLQRSRDRFESEVSDLMVRLLAKSGRLDELCKRHFGHKNAVKDIKITTDVEVVLV